MSLSFLLVVILSEAKDLLSHAPTKSISFASLRMTISKNTHANTAVSCERLRTSDQRLLSKLLQKPYIALKKQLNIIHTVFQNRNPLHAHAKGESRNLTGIVIHKAVHIGIDHAAA